MKSILFVCHGNICRSPMAEYIMKYVTDGKYNISSRATTNDEIGHDIYPPTKEVLDNHNIPYDKHVAKKITMDDFNNFDLIVCFDEENYSDLNRMFNGSNKIIKLLPYDIDDPWYTREFERCFNETYEGCLKLKDDLNNL